MIVDPADLQAILAALPRCIWRLPVRPDYPHICQNPASHYARRRAFGRWESLSSLRCCQEHLAGFRVDMARIDVSVAEYPYARALRRLRLALEREQNTAVGAGGGL